jgi:hypothetical protein
MRRLLVRLVLALIFVWILASLGEPLSHPVVAQADDPAQTSISQTQSAKHDVWDRVETISRTLSIAAIPVLLAIVGWLVQRQVQKQSVGKDYVQLAVSILREPDSSKVNSELRSWAVDLLNAYSVVKLSPQMSQVLKAGQAVLPPLEGFAATPSAALTPELQDKVQTSLSSFQQYLKQCGFPIRSEGTIKYEIVPGDTIHEQGYQYYAFYDPERETMKVGAAFANETDVIRHEYMRHVLTDSDHGSMDLHWVEDGSPWWNGFAISSGLAVYFPCSVKGEPVFAQDHRELTVNLKNRAKFRGRAADIFSADNIGDKVWGGAFWELREKLSDPKLADQLLAAAWVAWKPKNPNADLFVEFANQLVETDKRQSGGDHVEIIQAILRKRGLAI